MIVIRCIGTVYAAGNSSYSAKGSIIYRNLFSSIRFKNKCLNIPSLNIIGIPGYGRLQRIRFR